ncbi:putative F-box/LRR-repeat protein At4g15060 [Humulus lupulus]|uniref:putative F-box/LRR-repeat protein At4g15060 n=1 Tax=Humulus lupulus TaxID=3486 RepID=UPI002B404798|nr:putative F-box/LRR-repeat protein At4g15060 [Humulus lupulus]
MAKKGMERNSRRPGRKRVKPTSSMMGEDRISKLPDALIVHIMSFLPTVDVVRTCLLSKRWKLLWYSVPTISFSDHTCPKSQALRKFYNYVDNFLEHRKRGMNFIPDSVITSLKLRVDHYRRSKVCRLDKWLVFAVENKVKELNLHLWEEYDEDDEHCYYCLPKTLLVNAIYLTVLKLTRVELDSRYSFSFPSLKSLTLNLVQLSDIDVVDKLLLGSPSLEKLRLICCSSKTDHEIQIHSLSLKFLEIEHIWGVVEHIEAKNLESLELFGVCFNKANLSACKAIRDLSLTCDWGMDESSLEYFISNLPLLENLTLSNWYEFRLDRIKISSQHLKRFNLDNSASYIDDDDEMTVIIESAPKLESFCYKGSIKLSISMVESTNLLNGTFIILKRQQNYDANWFINMMNFLLNLNCSWNTVSLHVGSVEALIVPESVKRVCRSPLVYWEHLKVFTECKPERESALRDALLWISPSLKTLSIAKGIYF